MRTINKYSCTTCIKLHYILHLDETHTSKKGLGEQVWTDPCIWTQIYSMMSNFRKTEHILLVPCLPVGVFTLIDVIDSIGMCTLQFSSLYFSAHEDVLLDKTVHTSHKSCYLNLSHLPADAWNCQSIFSTS